MHERVTVAVVLYETMVSHRYAGVDYSSMYFNGCESGAYSSSREEIISILDFAVVLAAAHKSVASIADLWHTEDITHTVALGTVVVW